MRNRIAAYGGAVAGSVVAVLVGRAVIDIALALIVLTVLLVAYAGRVGPGLLAAALSLGAYVWLMPTDALRVGGVTVVCVVCCVVIEALHRSRAREHAASVARERSQRRFEQLFQACPTALSMSRLDDRRVVEVNAAYLQTFGVERGAIVGHTPVDAGIVIASDERDRAFATLRVHGAAELEADVDTPNGPRSIVVLSRKLEHDGIEYVLSTFLDVTEQKRAREAVHASDQRIRELAENLTEVVWLIEPNANTMLYVSPSYERMFGRSMAALYADSRDWLHAVHPDDRERMSMWGMVPVEERCETTYRIVRPDGAVRTIKVAISPVRDASGEVRRVAGVVQDVTEQLELETQVRQTQKLESVGLLAGGVAHDFNNILAVIAANARLLGEGLDKPQDHELVDEIEAAVRRATSLTRQLLAFSRKQLVEPIVLDLNAAVNDTRKMLRRMVGEDISIITSFEPDVGHVLIDPGYLVQVLMNLAVNARDAMPRGGILRITTRNSLRGGQREVLLSVSDTGCGIPPDVKSRIFEPFFTTKELGRGTGLGLSVVHGIVQQAGGRIDVASELGVGTTMKIFLPFVDEPAVPVSDVGLIGASGTEKILVVDDDMFVRTATSRALRARGYEVLEACDAHGALRLLREHPIDLLVTDVVMPGLDGYELAEAARTQRPHQKVLFISGYTDDVLARHSNRGADVAVLEKPFRNYALLGRVRQLLDAN